MIERIRWRIVHLLDKLRGQCWTDLVMWAIDGPMECRRRGQSALPWRPMTDLCRQDAARNDGCYCNKLRPLVHLRAGDAADHMIPGQPGDDDQFARWYLPNIRRTRAAEDAAETQATQGKPS